MLIFIYFTFLLYILRSLSVTATKVNLIQKVREIKIYYSAELQNRVG